MRRRLIFVAIAVSLFGTAAACGNSDPAERGNSVPGQGQGVAANPADADQKGQPPAGQGPATDAEQFKPVLARAYAKVTWPPKYTMTSDQVWTYLAPAAKDTVLVEDDATSMVEIWNTCAWTMQLIDDTKAGAAVDNDVASLNKLAHGSMRELLGKITADAKLGDITTAQQFVTANDCTKGFPR